MNMKKTIAAIAAGSVAVSAMATTVSAVADQTLNYNLVAEAVNSKDASGTVKAVFSDVEIQAGDVVQIRTAAATTVWGDIVTISGSYYDDAAGTNKAIAPIVVTHNTGDTKYTYEGEQLYSGDWNGVINVPVKAQSSGTNVSLVNSSRANIIVEWKYAGLDSNKFTDAAGVNGAIQTSTGIAIKVDTTGRTGSVTTPASAVVSGSIKADVSGYKLTTDKTYKAEAKPAAAATTGTTTATGTYAGNEKLVLVLGADGTTWAVKGTGTVVDPSTLGMTVTPGAAGDELTLQPATVAWDSDPAADGVVVTGEPADGDVIIVTAGKTTNNNTGAAGYDSYVADGNKFSGGCTQFTAGNFQMKPFKTDITPRDIVSYLESNPVNASAAKTAAFGKDYFKGKGLSGNYGAYQNVAAVLNDAVENYEGVTFKFNTATQGILEKDGVYSGDSWKEDYTEKYMAFGQHLYNNYYSPEGSGFLGYDWAGQNLFAGALVVNERLTMSLADTDYFDWTGTSISFDWDAIMDGAATTNNYATYIHTLALATSTTWYWDSLDVILTAGEADDVSADAGAEVDDATLDGDDDGEVIDGDDDDDVAPADDDDDVDMAPADEEPAPAPVVTNPSTGNASVALAVIPVALAAAAIVAKKRG